MTTYNRRLQLRRLAIVIACMSMVNTIAGNRPTPFIAIYDVHHSGARVAETTVMLTQINRDSFSLSSTTHPRGFAALLRKAPVIEHSRFEFTEQNQMKGIDYEFDDGSKSGKRNRSIEFDWDAKAASSQFKKRTYTIELQQPMGDRLAMQALLMRDLGENELRESYKLVDRDAIKTYRFTSLGEVLLDTPAGRFHTIKLLQQRDGSSRSYHIWLAREHDFAIVKMMQFKNGKPRTVLTATRVQSGVSTSMEGASKQPDRQNSVPDAIADKTTEHMPGTTKTENKASPEKKLEVGDQR